MTADSEQKLETWFKSNKSDPYPSRITKLKLAYEINVSYEKVQSWFKYRRRKDKKGEDSTKRIKNRLTSEQKILLKDYFNSKLLENKLTFFCFFK